MTQRIAVDSMPDVLLRGVADAHSFCAEVVGTTVRFESNSADVIDAAREFVRDAGGSPDVAVTDALKVCVMLHPVANAKHSALEYFSGDDGRLFIHSAQVLGVVEPLRRESIAYVAETTLANTATLAELLEALTFALVACFDRHPVHAAAIAHEGTALLLAGASGAGKSTLALHAHRRGYHVLSEDRVWVQLEPHLRVFGGPIRVRVRTSPGEKDVIPLERRPHDSPAHADRALVCILGRGRHARLDRLEPREVRDHLVTQLAPGFDRFPARLPAVLDALTRPGGWQLTLSSNPDDAMPFIRTMLEDTCE